MDHLNETVSEPSKALRIADEGLLFLCFLVKAHRSCPFGPRPGDGTVGWPLPLLHFLVGFFASDTLPCA